METFEVLENIGLNEKEAKVYLALLELGTASAYSVAPKAQLKRPITYIVLESLMQKGLVSQVPKAKKALYIAEAPEKLMREMRNKEELLKRFMPNLEALYNAKKEKPQVQLFEGVEGAKLIYNKILEVGEAWWFGTVAEIAKLEPAWLNDHMKKIKEKNIPVRDLLSYSPENIAYAKHLDRGPTYQIRFSPQGKTFVSDAAIFGNNVVFFSFKPMLFSVLITSKDISDSMRILHEMAWEQAKELEN